jgi:hypothetical protein
MMTTTGWWAILKGPNTPIRKDTHVTHDDAPVRPGINAQTPSSMPRAEDD